MKTRALFCTVFLLLLAGNISLAQNSILAGKIVDENNKPIPGAIIRISKVRYLVQELHADKDGLFYSKILAEGSYFVDVTANNKQMTAKKLFIGNDVYGNKKYYIIRVLEDRVVIDKVDEDPSISVKLGKLNDGDPYHTYLDRDNTGSFYLRFDSAGKVKSTFSSTNRPPKME